MAKHGEMFNDDYDGDDIVKQQVTIGIKAINDEYNRFLATIYENKALSPDDVQTICTSIMMTYFANGILNVLMKYLPPSSHMRAIDLFTSDINSTTKELWKVAIKHHYPDAEMPVQKLDS